MAIWLELLTKSHSIKMEDDPPDLTARLIRPGPTWPTLPNPTRSDLNRTDPTCPPPYCGLDQWLNWLLTEGTSASWLTDWLLILTWLLTELTTCWRSPCPLDWLTTWIDYLLKESLLFEWLTYWLADCSCYAQEGPPRTYRNGRSRGCPPVTNQLCFYFCPYLKDTLSGLG